MWTPQDKARFITALTAACELYGREMSDKAKAFYVRALEKHITADEAISALEAHIAGTGKESTFFPKPADLLRAIEGSPDDLVEQAWQQVRTAIEQVGPYESISFRDPLINAAIQEMGGWIRVAGELGSSDTKLDFAAHEFRRLYRGYLQTRSVPKPVSYLPGICERDNAQRGLEDWLPKPVTFGRELPGGVAKQITAIGSSPTHKAERAIDAPKQVAGAVGKVLQSAIQK